MQRILQQGKCIGQVELPEGITPLLFEGLFEARHRWKERVGKLQLSDEQELCRYDVAEAQVVERDEENGSILA